MIFCPSKSLYHQNYIKKHIKRTIKSKEYIDMMSIFLRPSKLCQKVISKLCYFFPHRNCNDQSSSNRRQFHVHWNYVIQVTSKQHRVFTHRNHVEKTTSKQRRRNSSIISYHLIATKNRRRFSMVCLLGNQLKLLMF